MPNQDSVNEGKVIRVLLADDHKLVGEAIATLLERTELFSVATAETFAETIKALSNSEPHDVVMLDLQMPGLVGLDGIRKVVQESKSGYVVLFTANADQITLTRALEVGVRGLIPKTMPLQSLISVLQLIKSGEMFVPANPFAGRRVMGNGKDLNDIELYVLRLVATGLTNKQIASDLNQSETNVKMYMRSLCQKLGASNRAHAAVIARDLSIIET